MSKQSKLFSKLVKDWYAKFFLSGWVIEIHPLSKKEFTKRNGHEEDKKRCTVAVCHVKWCYLEAFIDVNKSAIKSLTDEEIEYTVVHELMHIFLNEMREDGIEHEERVATLLARSFIFCDSYERGKE